MTRVAGNEFLHGVERLVTPEFLSGADLGEADEFIKVSTTEIDLESIRRLGAEMVSRFEPADAKADAWLAPRLHYILRLSRRQASDQGLWRWLALDPLCATVRHRWADKNGVVKAYRFLGGSNFLRRNALARLWWGAEVMRNGTDYSEVVPLFENSGVEQYVLDAKFGHLRPSAIAFSRVARGVVAGTKKLTFDQIRDLSKTVNLLLSAASLESLAVPGSDDVDKTDHAWLAEEVDVDEALRASPAKLKGPNDGSANNDEIREYEAWFAVIATDLVASKRDGERETDPGTTPSTAGNI